ncbi:hypothetical protein [Azospirillum halopraeferens]|uniref:hypothetical protein n=1 Tax=Azospirillum halopraeferens TaxID=34010 RepID=UPI0003FEFEE1|nr:hypothetical protein [Azospirillum halopraeferens]
MDARQAMDRVVADVARGLFGDETPGDGRSDAEMAQAFHLAIGDLDPAEYEDLLLTLPETALMALAAAGYVTTSHLMYACGVRGDVPEGAAGYLAGVLVGVDDAGVLERFVRNAWFGYAYGLSAGGSPLPPAPVVGPAGARAATEVLKQAMVAAGFSPGRADEVLAAAGRVDDDSAVDLPEAYVDAMATAALTAAEGGHPGAPPPGRP